MAIDDRPVTGLAPLFGREPQRLPPTNVQAEQALLGTLLSYNNCYEKVSGFLQPDHFADPPNCRIYQAISRTIEAGQTADPVTLKAYFEHSGILTEVGGTGYLTKLTTAMVSPMLAGDYARTVHDTWLRRCQIELAEQLIENAYGDDPDASAVDVLARHEDEIAALREVAETVTMAKRGVVTLGDSFSAAYDSAEARRKGLKPKPYSTGLAAVDKILGGGIEPGMFIGLLGASQSGKSELAVQIGETIAAQALAQWIKGGQQGPCPGVLYLMQGDMNVEQIGDRVAARALGIKRSDFHWGLFDNLDPERLLSASAAVNALPFEVRDDVPSTLPDILGEMRRFRKRRPLALAIIDNLSDILSMVDENKMRGMAIRTTKSLKDSTGKHRNDSAVMLLMHTNSSHEAAKKVTKERPNFPYNTRKDFHYGIATDRPILSLSDEPQQIPTKRPDGEELNLKWRREWADKREPWPVGVADITELIPIKMREEGSAFFTIGKIRFDGATNRYYDLDSAKNAPGELL